MQALRGVSFPVDTWSNLSPSILHRLSRPTALHNQRNHPICLLKERIFGHLLKRSPAVVLSDALSPIVSVHDNFDALSIPKDHPSRRRTDSWYVSAGTVLRTHCTTHTPQLLRQGAFNFAVAGDVYRRDEIDRSHYPVFHQLDIARSLPDCPSQSEAVRTLQSETYELVREALGGSEFRHRWKADSFPFTSPSFELELESAPGQWIEVLGCGLLTEQVLRASNAADRRFTYAVGIGLERLAMHLLGISDIRQFWSESRLFLEQYSDGHLRPFQPYSRYPSADRDISMWCSASTGFEESDFLSAVRDIGGDLVQSVRLVDEWSCPATKRVSKSYRIVYQAIDRTLEGETINQLQQSIREEMSKRGVAVR